MIKSNEVRIGNLLRDGGEIILVGHITKSDLGGHQYLYKTDSNGNYRSNLDPIPLTEEWLLKFGFEMDAYPQVPEWKHKSGFYIHDKYGTDNFSVCILNISVYIKHVHQLQNLYFALTGEELTIKEYNHG